MSRLYEALRRSQNDLAQVGQKVLGDAGLGTDSAPAVTNVSKSQRTSGLRSQRIRVESGKPLLPFDNAAGALAAEAYRLVRTKIAHHPKQPRMLVVTSTSPGDGKTLSAINIAGAFALRRDSTVLLVDADFRNSTVAEALGVPSSPGLAEVLSAKLRLDEAVVRLEPLDHLYLLPAGDAATQPGEFLATERWTATARQLRALADFVIIDSPPINATADFDLLEAVCDGTVMVVRQDATNRTTLLDTLGKIPDEKFIGIVLNCFEDWFFWKGHAYPYYSRGAR